ncbi:MAG: hypothetical protein LBI17_01545 [Rickettsiales bacterium]|jgi:hypothetical protein|nr:hypothetical protein [Rickettsiales bacterium]
MTERAGALASKVVLAALSGIALLGTLAALFVGLTLTERLDAGNLRLTPALIPEGTRGFRAVPLQAGAFSRPELEDFTKKLIVEYITTRYTVNGSEYLMERSLGLGGTDSGGVPMKILGGPVYDKFIRDEKEGIAALMASKTTRSVRIVGGPHRHADQWITEIELIYREPATANLADARRERWEIHMEVLVDRDNMFRAPTAQILDFPSTLFRFQVDWFERYEKKQ